MPLARNEEIELVVEKGYLRVRIVEKGQYPYFERDVLHEGSIALSELSEAIEQDKKR